MGRPFAWLVVAAAALTWTGVLAVAADAVVAKALLDSGKKAVAAKKLDEALPLFKKAFAEDPNLIEAVYQRAQVHDKLKDEAQALLAYREFLAAFAKKAAAPGGCTPEETKLKPLAEKRVDALAVAEREFQKLEDKYVADLLAVAKARLASDPGAALLAVNKILEVVPQQKEALALRDRLGEKTTEDPFAGIAAWRDLLVNKEIHGDSVTYVGDLMVREEKAGWGAVRPDPTAPHGKDAAIEIEFRVTEAFEQSWMVGVSFGHTKESLFCVGVEKAQIRLRLVPFGQGGRPGNSQILDTYAMPPIDPAEWHRFAVVFHDTQVLVFLDGEKVMDVFQTGRADPTGQFGVYQGVCRAEYRKARVGSFR